MNAGRMDRRVRVERATEVRDAATGEITPTWASVFTAWAERRDPRGAEAFRQGQNVADLDVVFRLRWREGVGPGGDLRLLDLSDDSRVFDIKAVTVIGRREGLELSARARAEAAAA